MQPETVIVIRCNKTEDDGKTPCIHKDCSKCRALRSALGVAWGGPWEIIGEADEWK